MRMSLFENIGEFIKSKGSWTQYTERLNHFFRANDIADDGKQVLRYITTVAKVDMLACLSDMNHFYVVSSIIYLLS